MYTKLTLQEKLKDLRKARNLTLKQLEAEVGIASSTLGEYENNEYKDISSHSLEVLCKYYGVSADYLLGITENKDEANTTLKDLHLTDDAVSVLKSGRINTRLLSEIIAHDDFHKLLIDSEIYVDRIAASKFQEMNVVLESQRQFMIDQAGANPEDIYMQTLKAAQISEDDLFSTTIQKDIMNILSSIREEHKTDYTTADSNVGEQFKKTMDEFKNFKGSRDELAMSMYLKQLAINPNKLTMEEKVTLINILRKSNFMKSPVNKRGKSKKKK